MLNKEKVSNIGFSSLIVFPILALFSGIGTHNTIKLAGVDSYISVLLAYFLGFIPFILFLLIFNYKKDLNIVDKIKYLFGNVLGTIINSSINILVLFIGITLFFGISNFAISQFLAETPIVVLMILIGLLLIYNVNYGIETISRVSIIFLGIILFLTIISTTGILPHFLVSNIKPTLENGIIPPLKGSIALILTNIVPIFILLIIPKNKIRNNENTNKTLIIFYTLAFILIFLAIVLTVGSLGIYLCDIYQYPEYTVLKKISLFNFLDRIENFIYTKWILSSFSSLSLIVYYLNSSIKKTSRKLLPTIIVIFMIYISLKIFKNNTIFYNFILNIYPYICLLLFGIYLIIGINIIIRLFIEKEKNISLT